MKSTDRAFVPPLFSCPGGGDRHKPPKRHSTHHHHHDPNAAYLPIIGPPGPKGDVGPRGHGVIQWSAHNTEGRPYVTIAAPYFTTLTHIFWPGSRVVGMPKTLFAMGTGGDTNVTILDVTHTPETPIAQLHWPSTTVQGAVPQIYATHVFQHVSAEPAVWEMNVKCNDASNTGRIYGYYLEFQERE